MTNFSNVPTAMRMAKEAFEASFEDKIVSYKFLGVGAKDEITFQFTLDDDTDEIFQLVMHNDIYFTIKPYDDINFYNNIVIVGNTDKKAFVVSFGD